MNKTLRCFGKNTAMFWKKHCDVLEKTLRCFGKNTAMFWKKHCDVLEKTLRCFGKNTVMFWKKHRDVLEKTLYRFLMAVSSRSIHKQLPLRGECAQKKGSLSTSLSHYIKCKP